MATKDPTKNAAHQAAWRARRKAELKALREQAAGGVEDIAEQVRTGCGSIGHVWTGTTLIGIIERLLDHPGDDEVIALAREVVSNARKAGFPWEPEPIVHYDDTEEQEAFLRSQTPQEAG
jgi:hypothetical protein